MKGGIGVIQDLSELKRQIAEKNRILSYINHSGNTDKEELERVNKELDRLLYLYYKSLISYLENCEVLCCSV